ncbi:MAG: protein O-GlcNAcase [Candidatus Nanopelagicales bacterium]
MINYKVSDDPGFRVVGTPPTTTDERYSLEVVDQPQSITVIHSSERGRRWGEAHARRLLATGALKTGTFDEFPRFAVRGIIEGFYGKPWSLEQRMDMIAFIGAHRMNTFVYSPKDDDYCRRRWDEPYPTSELAALSELVQEASSHGVDVSYGLSPGLSIRYSDQADVNRLLAKFSQVFELGVRSVQLQLDDIPMRLQHPQDRSRFPDLVNAQVTLIDRVRKGIDSLDPSIRLAVCPTVYNGRGDEPYLAALGAGTDPRVDLTWTGRAICSPELDLADAATFLRTTSRPVLYWDNYPVNDVAMTAELHIGAYRGRDPHLYRFARGLLANPMERPESSKIALATIADYLWDPEGYDPDLSWAAAITEIAGPKDADALRLFADNVRTSCLEESDSPLLTQALETLQFETEFGDPKAGRDALSRLAQRFADSAVQLLGADVENATLAAEIRPWVEVFASGSQKLLDMLEGQPAVSDAFGAPLPPMVFGDVLDMFVRTGAEPIDTTFGGT